MCSNQRLIWYYSSMAIDDNFGPVTLQRVQEFQTTTGLIASKTVDAKTWAKLLADKPTSRNTFYVPKTITDPYQKRSIS